MSKSIIVYPISGNPPTWGHADLMQRASQKFDQVHWVAAVNPEKRQLFSLEERTEMMNAYVDYYKLKNVNVSGFSGAIVRYAQELKASFLLRGLRNTTDFQMELELAAGNRGIDKNVETVCMFTKPHYATISSSLVRELAILGESIEQYVHPKIIPLIQKRLSK